MSQFLCAYDVRDKRRLARVYRLLCRYGVPIQESVFLLNLPLGVLNQCLAELKGLLGRQDDVRCYGMLHTHQVMVKLEACVWVVN